MSNYMVEASGGACKSVDLWGATTAPSRSSLTAWMEVSDRAYTLSVSTGDLQVNIRINGLNTHEFTSNPMSITTVRLSPDKMVHTHTCRFSLQTSCSGSNLLHIRCLNECDPLLTNADWPTDEDVRPCVDLRNRRALVSCETLPIPCLSIVALTIGTTVTCLQFLPGVFPGVFVCSSSTDHVFASILSTHEEQSALVFECFPGVRVHPCFLVGPSERECSATVCLPGLSIGCCHENMLVGVSPLVQKRRIVNELLHVKNIYMLSLQIQMD